MRMRDAACASHSAARCGTYHEPRPQKSRSAVALQRQQRANSRTEFAARSSTFTVYHFRASAGSPQTPPTGTALYPYLAPIGIARQGEPGE